MIIGIAGKYCSGKNTVGEILKKHGFFIIDMDSVGHDVLEGMRTEIIRQFGESILNNDDSINRAILGDLVFKNPHALNALENIIHPAMIKRTKRLIEEHKDCNVAINAALLFKMKLYSLCDFVLWINSSIVFRFKRGLERDNLSFSQILRRIRAQKKLSSHPWQNHVDIYTVKNSGKYNILEKRVLEIINRGL